LSSLNDKELEQLRSDIELTNKYIKEGLLKFDENMNVIYDKRNTNVDNFTGNFSSGSFGSSLSFLTMIFLSYALTK
jgi:hypothetical protein